MQAKSQLQMVWPERLLDHPPVAKVPPGYRLRTYRRGDEARFCEVMELAGFGVWDEERLRPWVARILPESWFMAVREEDDLIVATAMALHDHSDLHPFGGELGWVAADPAHWGKGLGMAVCAAVTARIIAGGYRNIHLFTEDFRLAALKTYLRLGYVPFLCEPDMEERWKEICQKIGWPFTPDEWVVPKVE